MRRSSCAAVRRANPLCGPNNNESGVAVKASSMRRQRIHMSANATSGMLCMAAETATRVTRIFHLMAARRTERSGDTATIESAVRETSDERS